MNADAGPRVDHMTEAYGNLYMCFFFCNTSVLWVKNTRVWVKNTPLCPCCGVFFFSGVFKKVYCQWCISEILALEPHSISPKPGRPPRQTLVVPRVAAAFASSPLASAVMREPRRPPLLSFYDSLPIKHFQRSFPPITCSLSRLYLSVRHSFLSFSS